MGFGMQNSGAFMGAASATNMQQMQMNQMAHQQAMMQQQTAQPQQPQAAGWTCGCGAVNTGNFCSNCGKPKPSAEWTCSCGNVNKGNFCSNCGKPKA